MPDMLPDSAVLPYFRLRLMSLLAEHEDLATVLSDPALPNLALLTEMHPYDPRLIVNHVSKRLIMPVDNKAWLRLKSDAVSQRIVINEKIAREKMLFWLRELHNDRQCQYFVLQSPYQLVQHKDWHRSVVTSLAQQAGGSGYHDYDTGRIPEEYKFIEPAMQFLVKLVVCLTLDEPWWDAELRLDRADIDRIVTYIDRLHQTPRPV